MATNIKINKKALLIHISYSDYLKLKNKLTEYDEAEINKLCLAANYHIHDVVQIKMHRINPATFISHQKVELIKELTSKYSITTIIINAILTPIQERVFSEKIKAKVIDRSWLILEIFSLWARSYDSKMQVKLAQYRHQRARLVRSWTHLERQRGSIGLRSGPGETQLESDRRALNTKILNLKKKVDSIRACRKTHLRKRKNNKVFTVALVGYTNSGKTTIFNCLSKSNAMAADRWFATLDPLLRKLSFVGIEKLGSGVVLDTVGFIEDLPKELKEAFGATLEQIKTANLILHVVDYSKPGVEHRMDVVNQQLVDLGITNTIPQAVVFNKIDLTQRESGMELNEDYPTVKLYVSALRKKSLDTIYNLIKNQMSIVVE